MSASLTGHVHVVPDLGDFLKQEVLPRLSPERVFDHPAHQWKKDGDKWRGGCPWHESSSGTSFYIDVPTLSWRCPACNFGGGPVQYRHRRRGRAGSPRGLQFIEILKELAELAGVPFPEQELTDEQRDLARRRETRQAILQAVSARTATLLTEGHYAWLESRGFTSSDAENLGLGYYDSAPDMKAVLLKQGFTAADIQESSVVWSDMEGYVVFPWHDDFGRPLTLYGKWPEKTPPPGRDKTIALPNPRIANVPWEATKRSCQYFDRALRAGHDEVVLVEGVTDAALAQVRGDTKVVACVGAQLSKAQVETFRKRGVKSVTIALDPDKAGDSGIRSCIDHLLEAGIAPYVAPRLPDGQDPDDFILTNGIDAWRQRNAEAVHGLRHVARCISEVHKLEGTWTDQARAAVIQDSKAFATGINRDHLATFFWPEIQNAIGWQPGDAGKEDPSLTNPLGRQDSGRTGPNGTNATTATCADWPAIIPLGKICDTPAFPLEILPTWLAEWTHAVAEAYQVPLDMPGMLALSAIGAGAARSCLVQVRPGWREGTNIFAAVVAPPGERKSGVMRQVLQPIETLEQEEVKAAGPQLAKLTSKRRILEKQIKTHEEKAAKADNPAAVFNLSTRAEELAEELSKMPSPHFPQFIASDATPEAVGQLLGIHGALLLADAEGTPIELAMGKYADSPSLEVYLKGHAGDPIRTNRIGRESDFAERPALSMALAVQPDVLRGMASEKSLRQRGFLARFLYSLPESLVGRREVAPQPVPEELNSFYQDSVRAIWSLPRGEEILTLSTEADHALRDFERWLEPLLAEGGELSCLAGWANKVAGAVARLAGIIHLAEAVPTHSRAGIISCTHAMDCIRFARDYLIPHAVAAFALIGSSEYADDANRIINWLKTNCMNSLNIFRPVKRSEIHARVFSSRRSVEEVASTVDLLEKHGYLRALDTEQRKGPGRKQSQVYEINPELRWV